LFISVPSFCSVYGRHSPGNQPAQADGRVPSPLAGVASLGMHGERLGGCLHPEQNTIEKYD